VNAPSDDEVLSSFPEIALCCGQREREGYRMSFQRDPFLRLVSDGDDAFNREDLKGAATAYLDAYRQLDEPDTPSLHLARAAIAHRLAAVEVIAGNPDRADQLADEVQVEAIRAKSETTGTLAHQFADDLAETSRTFLQ